MARARLAVILHRRGVLLSFSLLVALAGCSSAPAPEARATERLTVDSARPGAGRKASEAVTVLVSGRVIFDSAKSSPVRPAAEKFRLE